MDFIGSLLSGAISKSPWLVRYNSAETMSLTYIPPSCNSRFGRVWSAERSHDIIILTDGRCRFRTRFHLTDKSAPYENV